jgi:N-acyl-D-amino-acid deacylase
MTEDYDILIRNSRIIDGTGVPAFNGSVGVQGERIVAIGDLRGAAAMVIEGMGLVTCPGFVDPHSHADMSILQYPLAENLVMQGITTFVGGNCGVGLAPATTLSYAKRLLDQWSDGTLEIGWGDFDEWLGTVERAMPAVNYVPLVGHNLIRGEVMRNDARRKATVAEIREMKSLLIEAMESGGFGLSLGLDPLYPGHFATREEIVELAKVAQRYGGLLVPHTRHHHNQWPANRLEECGYGRFRGPKGEIITGRYHGLLEAVEICREANGIQLHISHLTPAYLIPQPHPGFLDEAAAKATLLDIVDGPRNEGLDVTYNVVAWTQTIGCEVSVIQSFLSPLLQLPDWLTRLSSEDFAQHLGSRAFRKRVARLVHSGSVKFGMVHPLADPYWMDCFRILRCKNPIYEGRTIGELARKNRPNRIVEAVYEESLELLFDAIMEDPCVTWAFFLDKREEGALPTFLQHPAGMPCSDARSLPARPLLIDDMPADAYLYGLFPPIAYGLYPHYIREFVKELAVLSLEQAVSKATFVPARKVFGLKDRGIVREGAYADLVLFDLDRVRESGDFTDPARPPEGIEHVLVNGQVVYEHKQHTGARPGKVLRRC